MAMVNISTTGGAGYLVIISGCICRKTSLTNSDVSPFQTLPWIGTLTLGPWLTKNLKGESRAFVSGHARA